MVHLTWLNRLEVDKIKKNETRRGQMIKRHIFIGLISLFFILSGCSNTLPIETNMQEEVADFSFTTQDSDTLSNDDLIGKWWIADFIFTNCETVCLPMTSNLAQIQQEITELDLPVHLVSFSVDPDYDTPEVLREYGDQYDANYDTWSFLTGYDFQTIKELSIKSFRAMLKEPDRGSDQVMHDTRFFLIDPEGNIVKGYDGIKSSSIDEVINDIKILEQNNLLLQK